MNPNSPLKETTGYAGAQGCCATEPAYDKPAYDKPGIDASRLRQANVKSLYETDQAKDVDGFTYQTVIDLRNRQSTLRSQIRQAQDKLVVIEQLLSLFA